MKRTIIIFVVATMVLITIILWALNAHISGNIQEILMIAGSVIIVGFAIYIGLVRVKSSLRKEPLEDELSKKVMVKTSSLSYYFSLYLWLFIMYISDRTTMHTHTLIGAGILGMAIIFFLCWLGIKIYGMKNG
jgi:peptidoglycan/LPS O-acetylase OafA/YrhL